MKLSKVALIGLLFVAARVHSQDDAVPASDDSPVVTYDNIENKQTTDLQSDDTTNSLESTQTQGQIAADAASDAGASDAQAAQIQNAIDNEGS
ncbi:unnamed protein product, partial [Aphanomyces euteiches]